MDTEVFKDIKTPSYVIDENKLIHNLKILNGVEKETGCHILLAQKAFSAYAMYPLIGQYISGTTTVFIPNGIRPFVIWIRYLFMKNMAFSPDSP